MPYALLEELQAEFETVSHAMSKIDELPEFVDDSDDVGLGSDVLLDAAEQHEVELDDFLDLHICQTERVESQFGPVDSHGVMVISVKVFVGGFQTFHV